MEPPAAAGCRLPRRALDAVAKDSGWGSLTPPGRRRTERDGLSEGRVVWVWIEEGARSGSASDL